MGKKVFIICPVREATEEEDRRIREYIKTLEDAGDTVHYPPRDTNQTDPIGYNICFENCQGIIDADEVHVFWTAKSGGSKFDLGMCFMAKKHIYIINRDEVKATEGKSFNNVLITLHDKYNSGDE